MRRTSSIYFTLSSGTETEALDVISACLHPTVQDRIGRYRSAARRNQTILGRALLAVALTELGETPDVLPALGTRIDGSPELPTDYRCSISHTDGLVGAVATCGAPIGLDIEQRSHHYAAFAHTFSTERCDHSSPGCDCLARAWVAKEAAAKAAMTPLSEALSAPSRAGRVYLRGEWIVSYLEPTDRIIGAIATAPHILPPSVSWLNSDQVIARLASS